MSAADDIPDISGVDPTPIDHPVDDEAIASAVNAAAVEVADAAHHLDPIPHHHHEAHHEHLPHDQHHHPQQHQEEHHNHEPLQHDRHHQPHNPDMMNTGIEHPEQQQQNHSQSYHHPQNTAEAGVVLDGAKPTQSDAEKALETAQVTSPEASNVAPSSGDAGGPTAAAPSVEGASTPASPSKPARKETKKRIRRVGRVTARKVAKIGEEHTTPGAPAEGTAEGVDVPLDGSVGATAPSQGTPGMVAQPHELHHSHPANVSDTIPRVLSKHDEKWNAMFDKLLAFKNQHNSTLVPQCYEQDPRLGRWVHYQRVEYWIYQQSGAGKITPERIARLEGMGFEWDPQRAQWNHMFKKLQRFKEELGHCKVPKGYTKDPELANWVRNQRLEHANMIKGKKSRMTEDRFKKLDDLGFRWSTSMTPKGSRAKEAAKKEVAAPAASATAPAPTTGTAVPEPPAAGGVSAAAPSSGVAAAVAEPAANPGDGANAPVKAEDAAAHSVEI